MTASFSLGDLGAILDHVGRADPSGALVPCGIRSMVLGRDAAARVPEETSRLIADGAGARPAVTLLVDAVTIRRRGRDLKADVESALADRFAVRTEVLTDDHPVLHADERAVETASRAVRGADAVVTVGGGTVTDIGKLASTNAGGVPHVVVQTAASVDGFTDNVSVILRAGVKRTIPSRWPDVVVADVDTIVEAPAGMNRAGFGEIMSMFVAPADWRLAWSVGMDASFHDGPTSLLDAVGGDIGGGSHGLADADPGAVEHLIWALAVRGIATGISGTTACLSGVEHLISHMLDLHHSQLHLPTGLHGAQVGVASVVAAAAWELLIERLSAAVPPARLPASEAAEAAVAAAFGPLDRDGAIVAECWRDYRAKLARWAELAPSAQQLLGDLVDGPQLRRLLTPSGEIASHLRAAGAPVSFADLEPSITPALARWALANCALMRNRFTVVDLLMSLGWWQPDDVDEVLERAQSAGVQPVEAC